MDRVDCIAVFGASGKTGQAVVAAALRRGLHVRALYRPSSEPPAASPGPDIITGQLTSPEDVRRALAGAGAACCVFGPRLSRPDARTSTFCEEATANVIAGMKSLGMHRLVCQTGAMAGGDVSSLGWFYRQLRRRYQRRFQNVAADREAQERVVRTSGLDWLLVRPPFIAGGSAKGRIRASTAMRIGFFSRAIVGDLAEFHCDELTKGRFHRQAVYVVG